MSDDEQIDEDAEVCSDATQPKQSDKTRKTDMSKQLEYMESKTIPENIPDFAKHVTYSNEMKFTPEETECIHCHVRLKEQVQTRKGKIVMMSKIVKGILYLKYDKCCEMAIKSETQDKWMSCSHKIY